MQELKKQVDEIFTMVSLLRVSGDAVDIVATVREKLRRLYKHIEKLPDTQPPSVPTTAFAEPATEEKRKLNPGPGPVGAPGPVGPLGQTGHEGSACQTASTAPYRLTFIDSSKVKQQPDVTSEEKEAATDGGQDNR